MNDGPTFGSNVRWVTYAELAELLGVEVASAQRRALRARWARQPGNDGKARVAVPLTVVNASNMKIENQKRRDAKTRWGSNLAVYRVKEAVTPDVGPDLQLLQSRLEVAETALAEKAKELAEVREDRAQLSGELRGLKTALRTALEHLHGTMAEAQQKIAEAQRRAIEAEQEAARAKGQWEIVDQTLVQLRSRGLLARLLNK
jgi:hypothetical protein